jgi:hypothetical protein
MIYFEIQLDGRVNVYDMSASYLMQKVRLEASAEALPLPTSLAEAHDFIRANCYQFEAFDGIDEAEAWAERYQMFRAGEVRASFRRFLTRRAALFLSGETNNTTMKQSDERKAVKYA